MACGISGDVWLVGGCCKVGELSPAAGGLWRLTRRLLLQFDGSAKVSGLARGFGAAFGKLGAELAGRRA